MLNIPATPYFTYKRHYIKRGVIDLRFPKVKFEWDKLKANFDKIMQSHGYALSKKSVQGDIKLKPPTESEKTPTVEFSNPITLGLVAHATDNSKNFQVQGDRFVFVNERYESFSAMWNEFEKIVTGIRSIFGVDGYNWLGIRKVNEYMIDTEGKAFLAQGLNDSFFSPVKNGVFASDALTSGANQYHLNLSGKSCIIKTSYKKQIKPNSFAVVIDLDVNETFKSGLNLADISKSAVDQNKVVFDIFNWMATDELKKTMTEATV